TRLCHQTVWAKDAFIDKRRWPRHHHRITRLPFDNHTAAIELRAYVFALIEPAFTDTNRHRSTSTGAARLGFTDPALINPQTDMTLIHDVHKADIDALWKGRMRFDGFTQGFNIGF